MSDAKVTFGRLFEATDHPGQEQTFSFNCPRRKAGRCEGVIIKGRTTLKHDPNGKNGGTCGWHGYIERGRCVTTKKQDEPEPT